MQRLVQIFALVLLVAGSAAAVDVTMRDGTVITAESYRLTGSYIMLKLANGSQVAYDAADVDLDALRAAEAAAAGPQAETGDAEQDTGKLSGGRTLKDAASVGEDDGSSLKISDRDVRHVRGSGVQGDGEEAEGPPTSDGGVPEGYEQDGQVVLNGLDVTSAGEGRWTVNGKITNRTPNTVNNVRVRLQAAIAGAEEPWTGEVAVTNSLAPDQSGDFSHSFAGEAPPGMAHPNVRASVIWMRQETTRTPDYTKAGGVPHPSNLPVERGGVTGADVVATPNPE
jgi:hypothetical protein